MTSARGNNSHPPPCHPTLVGLSAPISDQSPRHAQPEALAPRLHASDPPHPPPHPHARLNRPRSLPRLRPRMQKPSQTSTMPTNSALHPRSCTTRTSTDSDTTRLTPRTHTPHPTHDRFHRLPADPDHRLKHGHCEMNQSHTPTIYDTIRLRYDTIQQYNTIQYNTATATATATATVRYDTVRYDTIRSDPIRSDSIRSDPIRSDPIRYDTILYGTIRYDTRYNTIRYDTIRYDTIRYADCQPNANQRRQRWRYPRR